eukprot:751585-Hanusia_phi.AAC.1
MTRNPKAYQLRKDASLSRGESATIGLQAGGRIRGLQPSVGASEGAAGPLTECRWPGGSPRQCCGNKYE